MRLQYESAFSRMVNGGVGAGSRRSAGRARSGPATPASHRRGAASPALEVASGPCTGSNLRRLAASPDIEMLGVSIGRPAALLSDVLQVAGQYRKPAAAWNVQNRADLQRATKLGFQGIGSPAIRELIGMTLYR